MPETLFASFESRVRADAAAIELRGIGIEDQHISVIGQATGRGPRDEPYPADTSPEIKADAVAAPSQLSEQPQGVGLRAGLGLGLGAAAAMAALAKPRIGTFLGAAALAGGVAVLGALDRAETKETERKLGLGGDLVDENVSSLLEEYRSGGALMAVQIQEERKAQAQAILERNGARRVIAKPAYLA